ncbi:MAG: 50S ribosomal protein L16 [Candidatus Thermoplasmatota archaeon]
MSKKPGKMYREIKQQAYTRREYMGGVPANRITQFDMGDPNGNFPLKLSLLSKGNCQIRHTALEATRVVVNKYLVKQLGEKGFHLKIFPYPHHVLRENKQATGAGADRVSMGMRMSFGKAVGTAARVYVGQRILSIRIGKDKIDIGKEAMRRAKMKLPTKTEITIETINV